MRTVRAAAGGLFLFLLPVLAGCGSSYTFQASTFQGDVAAGRYEAALTQLEAFGKDDVAALLDRGVLLQNLGRLDDSDEVFERAWRLIDDLYTRSLSKEVLSFLTSDMALDYRAAAFEQAYIAYYRAWNYLERGSEEGALVEARRINERLNFQSASCPDQDGACGFDPFLRYFSGLLFEWGGEANDAYVAYKLADQASAALGETYGVAPPPDLGRRLVRLALALDFRDEAESYARAYGLTDLEETARGGSSVVFVFENGLIGHREETSIFLPIFKGEREQLSSDVPHWSETLAGRSNLTAYNQELDFLLKVALPHFVAVPPRAAHVTGEVAGATGDTRVVTPLSARAADALGQSMGGILVRATARALVKYLAKKTAEKELGDAAGLLANLFGVATERADTRSWRSLPYDIQVGTIEVPPGEYVAKLLVRDPGGQPLESREIPGVRVPARGGIAFIRHRTVS